MARSTPCVYCRQHPAVPAYRPFCSERCKMADLGQWLSGGYAVAGTPATPEAPSLIDDPEDSDA
jgi:endogenous inhibitor of DNA gyrase (YacG/DUF329 family)